MFDVDPETGKQFYINPGTGERCPVPDVGTGIGRGHRSTRKTRKEGCRLPSCNDKKCLPLQGAQGDSLATKVDDLHREGNSGSFVTGNSIIPSSMTGVESASAPFAPEYLPGVVPAFAAGDLTGAVPSAQGEQARRYGLMFLMAFAYMIETFRSDLPGWNHYKPSLLGKVGQHTLYGYIAFVESLVHFKTIQQQLSGSMPQCMSDCWGKVPDWQQLGSIYVVLGLGPMIFLELSNNSFPVPILAIFVTVLCASIPLELVLGNKEADHAFPDMPFKKLCNALYATLHALDEVTALILAIYLLQTGHALKNDTELGRSVIGMQLAVDLSWALFSAHHVFHQHDDNACDDDHSDLSDHSDHGHVIVALSPRFSALIKGVAIGAPVVVGSALLADISVQLSKGECPWLVMALSLFSKIALLGANHALMASALPAGFFNHQQPGLSKPELEEPLVHEF